MTLALVTRVSSVTIAMSFTGLRRSAASLSYLSWILTLAMLALVPTHSSSLMSSCPILTSTLPPRQLRLSKQCAAVRMCCLGALVLLRY